MFNMQIKTTVKSILQPTRLLCLWDFPRKDTGVGCHYLLQGIFPTQGSNPGLPYCRWILYHLSHRGSTKQDRSSDSGLGHMGISTLCCAQSCPTLWTVARQATLSMEFSRQEYWSGLPCPSPGDLLNPGIKPRSPVSQADSLPIELPGKPHDLHLINTKY